MLLKPNRIEPAEHQESVWDYPRPPRLEDFPGRVEVLFDGVVVATSVRAKRVLETGHPPSYYVPPEDVETTLLKTAMGSSHCEWKGQAVYYHLVSGDRRADRAAWSYPWPTSRFAGIGDYIAFYAGLVDECRVNGERVTPQPGGFYGGWITGNIVGPFKGEAGTLAW